MSVWPVILAGGFGTRLWPLSRQDLPKQFLPLATGRSLLQDTVGRLEGMEGAEAPVVVCHEDHAFLAQEQIGDMGVRPLVLIVEPAPRNTAPALTLAALALQDATGASGTDPVMLVMPADHVIRDVDAFHAAVRDGLGLAEHGFLVTFGVVPTRAETGYGYIRKGHALGFAPAPPVGRSRKGALPARGASRSRVAAPPAQGFHIAAFVEKPDAAAAAAYVASNDYLWNSGVFMMRASVWQRALAAHRPDIAEACRAAHRLGRSRGAFFRPARALFSACPSDSIDYAVMERAAGQPAEGGAPGGANSVDGVTPSPGTCAVVPLNAGWSDLGAWSTLWETSDRDAQGNVISGDVSVVASRDSVLMADKRLLAAVGLEGIVVVETADAVLVVRRDHAQDVREIVAQLKAQGRVELAGHRSVHRPWGTFEMLDSGPGFLVKRMRIKPKAATSLQRHSLRAEHWVVVKGTVDVTVGDKVFQMRETEWAHIPPSVVHRLSNTGDEMVEVVEVQLGAELREDDIVRLDDLYGRHEQE